jgi:hypothetical protein
MQINELGADAEGRILPLRSHLLAQGRNRRWTLDAADGEQDGLGSHLPCDVRLLARNATLARRRRMHSDSRLQIDGCDGAI